MHEFQLQSLPGIWVMGKNVMALGDKIVEIGGAETVNKHKCRKCRSYKVPKTCDFRCNNFCYLGEGDVICTRNAKNCFVLDGWNPTNDFYWCGGARK